MEELLKKAQGDCTEAIDSFARLTRLLTDQAQVSFGGCMPFLLGIPIAGTAAC